MRTSGRRLSSRQMRPSPRAISAARRSTSGHSSRRSPSAHCARPSNARRDNSPLPAGEGPGVRENSQPERTNTMSTHHIKVTLNGQAYEADVEARTLLVHFIRETLGLTGTHIGCDTTSCGACTIMLNGKTVKSCTVFAVQADGGEVMTVEGLAQNGNLHPIQEGFMEKHGLQCGFCTPGMMLSSLALLKQNPNPTEEEIRWALSGNLCRCTGYVNIVKAVQYAAEKMKAQE